MKTYHIILILAFLSPKINCYSQKDTVELSTSKEFVDDFYNIKFNIETVFDTIILNAIEIDSLNIKFKIMLDNHIKTMKIFNKNKHYIVARLWILNVNCIDKNEVDSICNLFVKNNFGDYIGYKVQMSTYRNNSVYTYSIKSWEKTFYYKYKNWDVVFVTNLNINFPNSGKIKELKFDLEYKDYVKNANGEYQIWETDDKKVRKIKNYESDGNSYQLFNHGVDKPRCKSKILY